MKPLAAVLWKAGYFTEYGEQLLGWLNAEGWHAVQAAEFPVSTECKLIIVLGMHFYPHVPCSLKPLLVGIQSEQLPLPGDSDWSLHRNRKRLQGLWKYYDLVIDWSPANYRWYPRYAPVRYLPYGCSVDDNHSAVEQKYDVLFLGNPIGSDRRRARILDDLRAQFRVCPKHFAWDEEKRQLIAESAVCLNLHQFHSRSFESPRLFELLATSACVLTEEIADSSPFVDGRDFLSFTDSIDACQKMRLLLADCDLRRRLGTAGRAAAHQFSFSVVGQLMMQELRRAQDRRRGVLNRLCDWGHARNAMLTIEFIDSLARLKRRLLN